MSIKKITRVSLFAALICILSLISIPIGTVPFTLQTLGIFLAGIILGPVAGSLAVIIYIILGVAGIPVFAGGKAGLQVLFGPTGGYIISFPIVAYIVGYATKYYNNFIQVLVIIASVFIVYLIGVSYLKFATGMDFEKAIKVGMIPFIIPDAIKTFIAFYLGKIINNRLMEQT